MGKIYGHIYKYEDNDYLRNRDKGLAVWDRAYEIWCSNRGLKKWDTDTRITFSYACHGTGDYGDGPMPESTKVCFDQASQEYDQEYFEQHGMRFRGYNQREVDEGCWCDPGKV